MQAAMAQINQEKLTNQQLLLQAAQLQAELNMAKQSNQMAADAARAEANFESRQATAAAFKDGMAYAKEMMKDLKVIMN